MMRDMPSEEALNWGYSLHAGWAELPLDRLTNAEDFPILATTAFSALLLFSTACGCVYVCVCVGELSASSC